MESFGSPIERLLEAMTAFVRTPATKLLHVSAAVKTRKGCIEAVMAYERDLANTAPFYLFEQEHTGHAPQWSERAEHARAQHAHRAELMEPHGESLETLPQGVAAGNGQAQFATALLQLVHAQPEGAHGMVVVLSPTTLDAVEAWHAGVQPLLMDPKLASVRFVIIETPPAPTVSIAEQLRDRADKVTVAPNSADEDRDVESMLEDFVPGAPPPGAAPEVPPPRHPSTAPPAEPTADSKLRGAIAQKLVASALAMKQGRAAESVQSTREARDLSAAAGLHRDAINLELMLGGQLLAAGSPKQSEAAFSRATETAAEQGKDSQVATGQFSLGASKLTRRDKQGALVCYAEGTVAAERSGQPALAIEGGRLTGSLAAELGMQAQAIAFYTKAVKLAEAAGPVAPLTSAGESARSLAEMCRKRGLSDQAAKFSAQADAFENLVEPDAPTALGEGPADEGVVAEPKAPAPAPEAGPKAPDAFLPVGVAAAPAGAMMFGAPPSEDEEGTGMLSLDDVARMRAGVEASQGDDAVLEAGPDDAAPSEGLDEASLEKLRAATFDVLDEDSSSMLSREELASLTGEIPFELPPQPDAPVVAPAAPAPEPADLGFDLSKLDALRDADIDDEEDGGATLHRRDAFEDE
ncbi:MAG: hypothetical protein ACRBN8_26405 [Nannocystales bacterium]